MKTRSVCASTASTPASFVHSLASVYVVIRWGTAAAAANDGRRGAVSDNNRAAAALLKANGPAHKWTDQKGD